MADDKVFTKAQEDQIRKARKTIDTNLGLDKYDHKKDEAKLIEKIREKAKASGGARGGGGGGGMKPDTDITASRKLPKMAKGGTVSASKRADGCATKGKTRGKMV